MATTLDRLNAVFCEVFDDDDIKISPETTAKDVAGWDSLMHVTLIVSVERAFQTRFSSHEVASLKNVGELLTLIEAKEAARK
jgi:acyl carrier protein